MAVKRKAEEPSLKPEEAMAERILRAMAQEGIPCQYGPKGALSSKLGDLLRDVGDPDQVELVTLTLALRDRGRFSIAGSLGWGSYDYIRRWLNVPDGAWKAALAAEVTTDPAKRRSLDYWINEWRDALELDPGGVRRAKQMIEKIIDPDRPIITEDLFTWDA